MLPSRDYRPRRVRAPFPTLHPFPLQSRSIFLTEWFLEQSGDMFVYIDRCAVSLLPSLPLLPIVRTRYPLASDPHATRCELCCATPAACRAHDFSPIFFIQRSNMGAQRYSPSVVYSGRSRQRHVAPPSPPLPPPSSLCCRVPSASGHANAELVDLEAFRCAPIQGRET